MTGKERSILDVISEDMGELKKDVKSLLASQAKYDEHADGCAEKFKALSKSDEALDGQIRIMGSWRNWISGGLAILTFLLGILLTALVRKYI